MEDVATNKDIAMANRETEQLFEGIVEIDETYNGGKPKKTNAILDKEGSIIAKLKIKRKRGRGTNKDSIVQ